MTELTVAERNKMEKEERAEAKKSYTLNRV